MALRIEWFALVHYLKFLSDDSGQNVVRIRELELQFVPCSSEEKLLVSPVQFHFEGIFCSIREDYFEFVYIVI